MGVDRLTLIHEGSFIIWKYYDINLSSHMDSCAVPVQLQILKQKQLLHKTCEIWQALGSRKQRADTAADRSQKAEVVHRASFSQTTIIESEG